MIAALDEARRRAARLAGFAYVATFAIVVGANFGIYERLLVRGDAAETARRILASETLFRVAIACDLLYCAGIVVLLAALYILLEPVSRAIALLAAIWRFVFMLMWGFGTLRSLEALRIIRGAAFLSVFRTEQLQALGRLDLAARFDGYYGGLLFFGLASTAVAYLLLESGFFPRALAVFGVIGSAWCALCAIIYIVWPDFGKVVNPWLFDSPMGLFELATGCVLLFGGLRVRRGERAGGAPVGSALVAAEQS
jgi:hypothetical protein